MGNQEIQQNKEFMIADTTATKRIFELNNRIRAVAGGTSASKTISIIIWLIDYCQTPHKNHKLASVVSESYPHLSGGAMLDFENIMKDREYWDDKRWVKSPKPTYTFETGNKIEFISVDTYAKAHGLRRDILFINEANNLPYNIADQLIIRTRDVIFMDWNPTNEFWFYSDMLGIREDIDFITLTYKDNEALDQNTISEIESHRNNKQWWQVYGLGQLGVLEGRIYTGWKKLKTVPEEARLIRYGMDFGFTNDPTAIVAVYKWNDSYILDEKLYLKGMSNKQIADTLLTYDKALVIADSAEPKSIDEIYNYGVNIVGSQKGKDSVHQGIQYVQDQNIFITERSIHMLKEYRNYLWLEDKDGKTLNEPSPIWNHSMDAVRYALDSFRNKVIPKRPETGGVLPYIEGIG